MCSNNRCTIITKGQSEERGGNKKTLFVADLHLLTPPSPPNQSNQWRRSSASIPGVNAARTTPFFVGATNRRLRGGDRVHIIIILTHTSLTENNIVVT